MKTIQVVNVRWFNATAWYGLFLSRLLRDAGHETLVVGLEGTESFRKAQEWGLDPVGLTLNSVNPTTIAVLYGRMRQMVRDFRPHVVNCHRGESFVLWGLLRNAGSNFALVRTRGDQRLPKSNLPNRWLHRSVADAVIATNSVMAGHLSRMLHVPAHKVHTILGGVNTEVFYEDNQARQAVRDEFGYSTEHVVIGLLGRFDRVKGQKELITAVAELYHGKGLRHIRLLLVGFESATRLAEVQAWIAEAGISDITAITGKRPDIRACICAMDVGVIASLWSEAIARAALEIMACGRPLVSTRVGVMPDLLPSDALCSENNTTALAELLYKAVADTPWREELGLICARRIKTLEARHFLDTTLQVYESLA